MLLIHIHQYSRRQGSAKGAKGAKAQGRWVMIRVIDHGILENSNILQNVLSMYFKIHVLHVYSNIYSMYFPCTSTHTALGTKMKQVFGCHWFYVLKIRFKIRWSRQCLCAVFSLLQQVHCQRKIRGAPALCEWTGVGTCLYIPILGYLSFIQDFGYIRNDTVIQGFTFGESFWVPRSQVCQFVAHLWHGFGMFWSHLWLFTWFIHRVQSCSNLVNDHHGGVEGWCRQTCATHQQMGLEGARHQERGARRIPTTDLW